MYDTPGYTEYGNQMDPDKNRSYRKRETVQQKLKNQLSSLKEGKTYKFSASLEHGKGMTLIAEGIYKNGKIGGVSIDEYKVYRLEFIKSM